MGEEPAERIFISYRRRTPRQLHAGHHSRNLTSSQIRSAFDYSSKGQDECTLEWRSFRSSEY